MKIKFFIYLSVVFFIAGCSLRPDLPQKDISFISDINSSKVSSVWWKDFNDPLLNALIEEGLKNNSDLQLAFNNMKGAGASLGLSQWQYLPNLSYKFEAKRQNNFPTQPNANSQSLYGIYGVLNYEIDLWGRVRNSVNAAQSSFKATQYDYETARLSIASNIANTYFMLVSLKEQEDILKNTLESYKKTLRLRENLYKLGSINSILYYQTMSQVNNAESQLLDIQTNLSKTNTALSILVGKSYNEILYGKIETNKKLPNLPDVPSGISSDILLHRSDVASALERLKASNFLVGVARADYFPQLSLTGLFGYKSTVVSDLFTKPYNDWSVAGSVVGPLFDFGRVYQKTKIATVEQNASFVNYEKALNNAFGEVKDSLEIRKNLILKQKSMENFVKSQQRVYSLADERFKEGYSDYFELLDAQRQLLLSKIQFSNSKLEALTSVVGVYKAFGGGFEIDRKGTKTRSLLKSNDSNSTKHN